MPVTGRAGPTPVAMTTVVDVESCVGTGSGEVCVDDDARGEAVADAGLVGAGAAEDGDALGAGPAEAAAGGDADAAGDAGGDAAGDAGAAGDADGEGDGEAGAGSGATARAQLGRLTVFVSNVTAPVRASSRPVTRDAV